MKVVHVDTPGQIKGFGFAAARRAMAPQIGDEWNQRAASSMALTTPAGLVRNGVCPVASVVSLCAGVACAILASVPFVLSAAIADTPNIVAATAVTAKEDFMICTFKGQSGGEAQANHRSYSNG
jgi:hypothetical protein